MEAHTTKGGESVLQFPTNIYPQNVAFDPSISDENSTIRFVFNGDFLTTVSSRVYNYMTGELLYEAYSAPPTRQPKYYNGETVEYMNGVLSGLPAGQDYVIQMMLTQSSSLDLVYDMPVVRGEVQSGSSGTSIMIEDKINNIYEWTTYNGLNIPTTLNGYRAAGMIIKIGTEARQIESYNKATGELIINTAFDITPEGGDSYIIYSNYLVTPQYYFSCRTTPTLTVTTDIQTNTINVEGNYGRPLYQNNMIKYYTLDLYWWDSELDADSPLWELLRESPKVYSQKIEWSFVNSLVGINNAHSVISDVSDTWYKVVCTVVTQEGMSVTTDKIIHLEENDTESEVFDEITFAAETADNTMPDYLRGNRKAHQAVKLIYSIPIAITDFEPIVYRRDLENNEVMRIGATTNGVQYDYLVPNKGRFEYVCVPRDNGGSPYVNAIKKTTIVTNFTGYSITALIPYSYQYKDMRTYTIGDCWKFVGEVEDVTVSQNISRAVHVGTGKYASVSSGDTNYASGTLSAMIGAVDCTTKKYMDTIDMVKAWREFITQDGVFLLKSQKGDVWVVNITDVPTTTYQEDSPSIPTTFSFSWAECLPLEKVFVVM